MAGHEVASQQDHIRLFGVDLLDDLRQPRRSHPPIAEMYIGEERDAGRGRAARETRDRKGCSPYRGIGLGVVQTHDDDG